MHRLLAAVMAFSWTVQAVGAAGQTRDRPTTAAAASPSVTTLAAGWTALASGQRDAAVRNADVILQQRPWDHAAVLLKISALASGSAAAGLGAYGQWLVRAHTDDVGLLEPVLIAVLREAVATGDEGVKRLALTALVAAHVDGAAQQLAALPGPASGTLDRDIAAARGGDIGALQRLSEAADPRTNPRNPALARALADAGQVAEPALLAMLASPDGETRAAAAKSLGALKSEIGRSNLQKLSTDPDPRVRTNAEIALAKLGDPAALASVDRMLASGVPEVQLAAADAWEGRPGPWVDVVRPLLNNPDGLTRIHAAQAIAPADPQAARQTLADAAKDPNPVMRAEAAAAVEALDADAAGIDVGALRAQLSERDLIIRVSAARALLRLVRG